MSYITSLLLTPAPETIVVHTGSGTGAGARTATFTVTLGGAGVQGANVRVTRGLESFAAPTDATGTATFHLDDGTWAYVVTKTLCVPQLGSLAVDGDEAQSVALLPVAMVSPPDASGDVEVQIHLSDYGAALPGVEVTAQLIVDPKTTVTLDGRYDANSIKKALSDVQGVAKIRIPASERFSLDAKGHLRAWRFKCTKPHILEELIVPATGGNLFLLPKLPRG